MNSAPRSNTIDLLPESFLSGSKGYPAYNVGMRRFGIAESDLAIDFTESTISALITRLLEQCAVDPESRLPAGFFRELSVGRRLECLLALAADEQSPAFNFPFYCTGCGQEIEFDLSFKEIALQQRAADRIALVNVEIDGKPFALRKPCGRDQENWAKMVFCNQREAAEAMIGSLAATHAMPLSLDPDTIDRIDEAMDAADPLVNFFCRITCLECDVTNEFFIDLGDAALRMLQQRQKQLIVMVHKLASYYHWSEKEIFAIPHWRRIEYLDLIATGR
jgi:hypothetical protein